MLTPGGVGGGGGEEIKPEGAPVVKKRISLPVRGEENKLVWALHRIKLRGMLHQIGRAHV